MTATKKPKSKSVASERGQALQVSEIPPPRRKDSVQWHEQAAFHLTLDHAADAGDATIWRTHVYHEESGEEQTQPGILQQDIVLWIRERAGAPKEAQDLVATPAETPQSVEAPQSALIDAPIAEPRLSVYELIIEAIEIEPQASGTAKRLRAQARFAWSNVAADQSSPHMSHGTIQVLAVARESGQTIVLGVGRQQLAARDLSYIETFEFDLPPLGEYQTIANVVLEDEGLVGAALGPVLTIVP
jgi:hypothetical protein